MNSLSQPEVAGWAALRSAEGNATSASSRASENSSTEENKFILSKQKEEYLHGDIAVEAPEREKRTDFEKI
jgi:hypothetical protein